MKLKERTPIIDHLNAFQTVVDQLATMKMVMDDEMQISCCCVHYQTIEKLLL